MNVIVISLAVGIGCLLAGFGAGFWLSRNRAGKEAAKAEDVQKKFDDYRENVTEHFGRTAEHFQTIGQQYRELYEHMASGAETFGDRKPDGTLAFEPAAQLGSDLDESQDVPRDYVAEEAVESAQAPVDEPVPVAEQPESSSPADESVEAADSSADEDDSACSATGAGASTGACAGSIASSAT